MSYSLVIEEDAEKDMRRLSVKLRKRIDVKIQQLSADPRPRGCLKLEGFAESFYRIRVGTWRILYMVDDAEKLIMIIGVKPRPKAYG